MKINILQNSRIIKIFLIVAMAAFVISCNKELPKATPIIYPLLNNSTTTIGSEISTNPDYTFFKAAATRVGILPALSDSTKIFTVFLPDNNAFLASGIPSIAVINSLPLSMLVPLIQYHIIPGQQFIKDSVHSTFPNVQLPSYLTIGVLPGTTIPLKMSTFPSARTDGLWDNNIPVIQPDLKFSNGVVHVVAALVAPPSQVLKDAIYNNPNLTFFKAAIARGDSGQTGLNKIDSLLGYAVTNMTVLAPADTAFQSLLYATIYYALIAQGAPDYIAANQAAILSSSPAIFSNPSFFDALSAATVRGLVVYHFLATNQGAGYQPNIRAFSVNFSATPAFYTTLVNSAFAQHPGILAQATFTPLPPPSTAQIVTKLQFTGLGTFPPGGPFFSGGAATATSLDNHCVNGVYYVIDKVLLPQ